MLDPWCLRQRRLKKSIAMAMGFRKILNGAAALHATTPIEAKSYAGIALKPPVEIVPLGLMENDLRMRVEPGRFLASQPRLRGQPYLLFLSRLHQKKGLDYLIDAFVMSAGDEPTLQLVIAGPDDGEKTSLLERIAAAGLQQRVHVIGPIWGIDKFAAMSESLAFVLVSRQENFGMVVAEAMWAGVPVIISDQVQLHEDVTRAGAGIVVPLDVASIAQAMRRMRDAPALRQQMGRAGHDWVDQNLRWPRIIERLEACYARAISPVRPRPT
jgi:glycosyltransferase involved in cell wall biosynthesis